MPGRRRQGPDRQEDFRLFREGDGGGHSADEKVKVKNYIRELRDATRIYEINVKLDEATAP